MRTIWKNVRVLTPFVQRDAIVVVDGGRISAVCGHYDERNADQVMDGGGRYLAPGFIDLHVHGGGGRSVMEGSIEAIHAIGDAHAALGTTSLLPTTLSMPMAETCRAAQAVADAMRSGKCAANILGLHMEGPFLSPLQSGAQAPDTLLIPSQTDLSPFHPFLPILRMMGVAPELDGGLALGEWLAAHGVVASIAHSNATYEQAREAVAHGFSDVTHLYSGCSTVTRVNAYRIAGVVEAGLECEGLTVQAISDGKHLPDSLLRLIYRCKGPDGMYAITDGLEFSAFDAREGERYTQQNGVECLCEDGVMKLPDRTAFAGSICTMRHAVYTLRNAGIPLMDAVRMATDTPARRIGALGKGQIAVGYDADLVLFDEDIGVKACMVDGKLIDVK